MSSKVFCLLFLIVNLASAGSVYINHDKDDCRNGWSSMDVRIQIDNENFTFNPSCNYSFNKSFKTKSGVTCQVNSGMCSSFSPRQQIYVSCNNSSRDTKTFECQKAKPKTERNR